jgi:hypothetical protein
MKRNVYRVLSNAETGCTVKVSRWIISRVAQICNACGVKFKVDDESIDYENDSIVGIVAADNSEDYIAAAQDLHNELGIDLA